jgi:hypothetical protein
MKMITKHQTFMANHQVMMQAPGERRQKYFDEVFSPSIKQLIGGRNKASGAVCKKRE